MAPGTYLAHNILMDGHFCQTCNGWLPKVPSSNAHNRHTYPACGRSGGDWSEGLSQDRHPVHKEDTFAYIGGVIDFLPPLNRKSAPVVKGGGEYNSVCRQFHPQRHTMNTHTRRADAVGKIGVKSSVGVRGDAVGGAVGRRGLQRRGALQERGGRARVPVQRTTPLRLLFKPRG